ncbi:hypothetical protein [Rhodoflexus caldus]|uniref:hypothetical protein n=1 Tax=Rhodoflexus caldus TaxID=2891236 RepID=UPI002029F071|nr:hypothetical protein [Rhodoflexus caldus]
MNHIVRVIFGKEQVIKAYSNQSLTEEEKRLFVKEYEFGTLEEKLAFIKGLNEAIGWVEFCIPELELCDTQRHTQT